MAAVRGTARELVASLVLTAALLPACGPLTPAVECHLPLSQGECDDAIAQARTAVDESADLRGQVQGEPIRLTEVWQACSDAGCIDHATGFAFVRMQTDDGTSLGRVIVCIDSAVCGGRPTTFGFP